MDDKHFKRFALIISVGWNKKTIIADIQDYFGMKSSRM
jgi:hypothetical protein